MLISGDLEILRVNINGAKMQHFSKIFTNIIVTNSEENTF